MTREVTMLLAHYPPDVAADGQLFALLAREMVARGGRVTVLTWHPSYQGTTESAPEIDNEHAVRVVRLPSIRASKSLVGRGVAAGWKALTGLVRAGLVSRTSTLLTTSSPPTLGLAAAWATMLKRQRMIYVLHDIHPHLGIALGKLSADGSPARVIREINRRVLTRADHVVALTEGMKAHALAIHTSADVRVIPNWVDTDAIRPIAKTESAFAREHGYDATFTLQYSGNLGLLHPLAGLCRALRGMSDVRMSFIGRGARLAEVQSLTSGIQHVDFHDYRPLDALNDSLTACDVAVVAIDDAADRLAMPSKIQGILAAGRPILALASEATELAQLVSAHDVGVVANPNDPTAIRTAIDGLRQNPVRVAKMGDNARALAESEFGLTRATDRYLEVLSDQF